MAVKVQLGVIKLWKGFQSIALEMSALLFMTTVLMTYLLMQDFTISRVCRVNLGYSQEVCDEVVKNTGNYSAEESSIQMVMTDIRKVKALLDYTIPIAFVILQGAYGDSHGRKLSLLLPCAGFIIQAVSLIICMYFENLDGYAIVLISTIPKCLSGSDVTFRMATLSYVSDITTSHARTLRTGLISAAFILGVPLGFAIGGAVVKASVDLAVSFAISAAICTTGFFLIVFFVDNKPKLAVERNVSDTQGKTEDDKKCFTFSNIKSVARSLVLSFDGVSMGARIQIFVLIFAIICVNAPIQGEFGVMYLYLRKKLGWDLGDYGLFSTYVSLIGVIGTILSMGVFCSLLKLRDPVIGFIAGISQFGGCFMYAFAYNRLMIYSAPTIDMLNGTMAVVAKSMLSKLIPHGNYGKLFSVLAVIELLVPLGFDPTYSTIYGHTMDTFPGAVFLLSAALTVPPQLTYLFYIWKDRNAASCEISDGHSSCDNQIEQQRSEKYLESLNSSSQRAPVTLKSAISTSTVDTVLY